MTAEQLAALRLRLLMPDPWLAALRFPGLHADMLCWHDLRSVAGNVRAAGDA